MHQSYKSPTIVILAGGNGTRFAPFVTNKLLWPICGKPFLFHVYDRIIAAGATDIIAITSIETDEPLRTYATQRHATTTLRTTIQQKPCGMDNAILVAQDLIGSRPIVVLNGDDLIESTFLQKFLQFVSKTDAAMAVAGFHTEKLLPVGYYVLDTDGNAIGVVEKPHTVEKRPSTMVRLTCDYIADPQKFIQALKIHTKGESDATYEYVQTTMLRMSPAPCMVYTGSWAKLKYPHDVIAVQNILLQQSSYAYIHTYSHAQIDTNVYIDPLAKIGAFVVIKGPSYIGPHAVIGDHTLVRQSIVEHNCVIGFGTEICRSYVGPHTWTHHAFVGDSVIEGHANISWGSVTANMRTDGREILLKHLNNTRISTNSLKCGAHIAKGVFFGINTQTMPGICITQNTKTAPNTTVLDSHWE